MLISLGRVAEFLGDSPGQGTLFPPALSTLSHLNAALKRPGMFDWLRVVLGFFGCSCELGNLLSTSLWG